ncbi:MAG: EAL domain-containing protein, partial [Rhodospirillales bacterium]|nr:EAL domain-containing protein [Rhodospirillales bacterium]
VVIADSQFNVTSVNPAFTDITGYSAEDVIGKQPPFLEVLKADPVNHAKMRKAIQRLGHWEGEIWNKRKNGDDYAESLSISSINDDDGRVRQYAALIGDITKRKQDEEHIRYQANFDSLTGLPNRTLFVDRLTQALVAMGRKGKKLALMFIDLDGFKLVNDTMGHDIGDLLLKEAAVRLSACVRSGDTVARLGGDEFTVIMPDLADPRNAPMVAQRTLDSLAKPFVLEGQEAFVSGSIGITIFPDDAGDANELLRKADAAMYRAKERGKANYQFFTADLNEEVRQRLILRNNLVKAIERNEMSLHFQPKIELKTRKISGLEALMRWNNAELGSVPPSRFIPVLEESGMALEFGRWVVQSALDQFKAIVASGLPPLRIAINLTTRQLREPRFVSFIERALSDNNLSPDCLEIEVTEMMLMSDSSRNVTALGKLHDLGIRIAMDDFGTGYSSLVYLKRYPIDTIKIDRSFIANITKDPSDAEVVRAIIGMGQSLRRRVAAEGVETEEQLVLLSEYACDEAQGYAITPPLSGEDLIKYLKKQG